MKTKEELCALKEEVETMNKKLAELSDDELNEVTGGIGGPGNWNNSDGQTSTIITDNDKQWLYEESYDRSAWHGMDNSK